MSLADIHLHVKYQSKDYSKSLKKLNNHLLGVIEKNKQNLTHLDLSGMIVITSEERKMYTGIELGAVSHFKKNLDLVRLFKSITT